MCVYKQSWPVLVAYVLLCPAPLISTINSTPIFVKSGLDSAHCAHDSISELIKKSPVILKALGAHIFTDDTSTNELLNAAKVGADAHGGGAVNDEVQKQNLQNNLFTSATFRTTFGSPAAFQQSLLSSGRPSHISITGATATSETANSARMLDEAILITLTPETIYKGASLLKMTPGAENAARGGTSRGGSSGRGDGSGIGHSSNDGTGSGGSATAESAYQYEGQLNATLQPLSCFDGNLLKSLPTKLIVFGKLITVQQQQLASELNTGPQTDFLAVSINGLHRWSSQFENHIWKHLGWDDWSDFTLCSVTCGKGVQQRFRRCLLDNPMVNFNMHLNLNAAADSEIDEDGLSNAAFENTGLLGNALGGVNGADFNSATMMGRNDKGPQRNPITEGRSDNVQLRKRNAVFMKVSSEFQTTREVETLTATAPKVVTSNEKVDHRINTTPKSNLLKTLTIRASAPAIVFDGRTTETNQADPLDYSENIDNIEGLMRTFDGNIRVNEAAFLNNNPLKVIDKSTNKSTKNEVIKKKAIEMQLKNVANRQHKRRRPMKNYSTMFCEGYNIEQRNCNTFDCSDDLNDLLKFYKKVVLTEEAASPATVSLPPSVGMSLAVDSRTTVTLTTLEADTLGISMAVDVVDNAATTGTTAAASGSGATNANDVGNNVTSTTPANMGYIRGWRNPFNFTIMLTLRVRNGSKAATTIFSIRNATHNMYLESCKDGLRLYLERDGTTEMLPVKFNLYDFRWHQVAISIQNGDFISIYTDCSWTNSFVVSKRLYTLPLDADVEIGRGFNGELQQLLVLPDNQERHQCSNKRTSINEVKRYIIDTFIDDYGN